MKRLKFTFVRLRRPGFAQANYYNTMPPSISMQRPIKQSHSTRNVYSGLELIKRIFTFLLPLSAAFVLGACQETIEPFDVTKEGKPVSAVVISDNAPAPVKTAAREFVYWVKQISGADLPVRNTPGAAHNQIVFSCAPDVLTKFPADAAKIKGTDGFAVRRHGNTLYVIGAEPKGVLNGALRLLFRNTDIIWARPAEEFGTLYSEQATIAFTQTDFLDIPKLRMRGWQVPYSIMGNELQWIVRNCCNWSNDSAKDTPLNIDYGMIREGYNGHNICWIYLQPERYLKEHPEYYSLIRGERIPKQLCFTHNKMTEAFCRELDKRIADRPDLETYGVCIQDNSSPCQCENCRKDIVLPSGTVVTVDDPAHASTRFFQFLQKVADHVQQHHPGKTLQTFAYGFTETPPAVAIPDNVAIIFCPITKNAKFPIDAPENRGISEKLDAWLNKTTNIILYEYYGLTYDYPRPIDTTAFADWRTLFEHGITRTRCEIKGDSMARREDRGRDGGVVWDCNSLYFWTMAQGVWDPYQDVTVLRDEYLKRVFGPATPEMKEYFSLTEKAFYASPEPSRYDTGAAGNWWKLCELGLDSRCAELLAQARAKPLSQKSRIMLERLAASFEGPHPEFYRKSQSLLHQFRTKQRTYRNMVVNGTFEDLKSAKSGEIFDWDGSPACQWSFWQAEKIGHIGASEHDGVDGSKCIWLDRTGNSCFIQQVPVKKDGIYIVRGKARCTDTVDDPCIVVRWQSGKRWCGRGSDRQFYAGEPDASGWRLIEGVFSVPAPAERAVLLTGSKDARCKVFFDDIEMYELE